MNMKSIVFALLLSHISMVMATDWVQVSKTNENGTRFYVDVDSINGDESLRKALMLIKAMIFHLVFYLLFLIIL